MEATAIARFIRTSPRKTRLVVDLVRGKSVQDARVQLQVLVKGQTKMLLKLLNSAVSNAEGKKMNVDNLYIKKMFVDGGPMAKRSRPRAFGRSGMIRKRTSHITIVLAEK